MLTAKTVEPIFHCNAKPFMLGPNVGLDPQCHNFSFGIPTCWYLNAKFCVIPDANAKICVTPNANPQCEQVEYRQHWVPNARGWHRPCRFHVVCLIFGHVWKLTQTQYPVEYRLNAITVSGAFTSCKNLRIHC